MKQLLVPFFLVVLFARIQVCIYYFMLSVAGFGVINPQTGGRNPASIQENDSYLSRSVEYWILILLYCLVPMFNAFVKIERIVLF